MHSNVQGKWLVNNTNHQKYGRLGILVVKVSGLLPLMKNVHNDSQGNWLITTGMEDMQNCSTGKWLVTSNVGHR